MLAQPFTTVAQTWAESYQAKTLTKTKIECAELEQRAAMNAKYTAIRHQINLEAALEQARLVIDLMHAQGLLPEHTLAESSGTSGTAISSESSDPDWFHRWAGYAKECSDEEIRSLWAKVLAGEIVQPGRFSLRLLHTVSLLRKSEAQNFQTVANLLINDTEGRLFFLRVSQLDKFLKEKHGIDLNTLRSLEHLGLIEGRSPSGPPRYLYETILLSGANKYSVKQFHHTGPTHPNFVNTDSRLLTDLGAELYCLCKIEPDEEYAELLFTKTLGKDRSGWVVIKER